MEGLGWSSRCEEDLVGSDLFLVERTGQILPTQLHSSALFIYVWSKKKKGKEREKVALP
jgi:hypothetical protein